MSCPYLLPDCPEQELPADAASCTVCGRFVKRCQECGAWQRALANFCRDCGAELPEPSGNWLGARGGAQRLGLNDALPPDGAAPSWEELEIREVAEGSRLDDSCRSLLGCDGILIAISQAGTVEIGDPRQAALQRRFKVEGPVSCEPCIDRGVLYLGSPGRVSAYSLGALTLPSPRLSPLWQQPVAGTPIQALTALDGRLYVTTFRQEGRQGRREVQVIETRPRVSPGAPRPLFASSRLSWIAADPASRLVVFLSEEAGHLQLHTVTHDGPALAFDSRELPWRPLADQVPIAFLGGKVFGVFGDEERLAAIDVETGSFELDLDADTKLFSLTWEGDRAWDGDGVRIDTQGVVFLQAGVKDVLPPLERVARSSPVLLRGSIAVVATQDGRLRFYDLTHPPRQEVRRLAAEGEPITALASFQRYIAAGDSKGVVKVFELGTQGKGIRS